MSKLNQANFRISCWRFMRRVRLDARVAASLLVAAMRLRAAIFLVRLVLVSMDRIYRGYLIRQATILFSLTFLAILFSWRVIEFGSFVRHPADKTLNGFVFEKTVDRIVNSCQLCLGKRGMDEPMTNFVQSYFRAVPSALQFRNEVVLVDCRTSDQLPTT